MNTQNLNVNLDVTDDEYMAGVVVHVLDRHHMLVMWRETYLQTLAQSTDEGEEAEAAAAAAADRAVDHMYEFIDSLDATDEEEEDEPAPVVVPGRPS